MFNTLVHNPVWNRLNREPWGPIHYTWNTQNPTSIFGSQQHTASAVPAVDIEETDTEYRVAANLPGVARENIEVSVQDDVLSIAVQESENTEQRSEGRIIRKERYEGKATRTFRLGKSVESDKIQASYEDGVLKISVPKKEQHIVKVIEVSDS